MINITFHKTRAGEYRDFICEGHAGFAAYGEDIVCAAVSALVINTVNSLDEITDEAMEVVIDEKRGMIRCLFTDQTLQETSRVLMDSLVLGLSRIEEQYGKKHCRLHFKEV